jgi:tetratricopeptide (TPR) repeat protein/DNA-binding NarL/FixJ family response regulator
VLFVEPDVLLRDVLEEEARRGGFRPLSAGTAAEARAVFAKESPDAVVTELDLPGDTTGVELIASLRRTNLGAAIPILALAPEDTRVRAATDAVIAFDVDDFFAKPVHGGRLLWRLGELLSGRPIGAVDSAGKSAPGQLRSVLPPRDTDFLQGRLGVTDIAPLFFSFAATARSGKLCVMSEKTVVQIWFRRGWPVFAESNRDEDDLGDRLVKQRVLDADRLREVRAEWRKVQRTLPTLLVAAGAASARKLLVEQREAATDTILSVFAWREGQYYVEYLHDATAAAPPETISLLRAPAWFVMEGLKRHASAERCRSLLGGAIGKLGVAEAAHHVLREFDEPYLYENLLAAVGGDRTSNEVMSGYPFSADRESLAALAGLWVLGAVVEQISSEPRRPVSQPGIDPKIAAIRAAVASASREHPDAAAARRARVDERMVNARDKRGKGSVSSILSALDKVSSEVSFENGWRALQQRDFGTAVRELWGAARLAPGVARYQFVLGQACLMHPEGRTEDVERALQALKRAAALEPEHGGTYHWLGVALYRLGHREEARLTLRRAMEFGSEHEDETRLLLQQIR